MKDTELLGLVSFCVLMEGGGGIMSSGPCYISEKAGLLNSPFGMYNALDSINSMKVMEWGKHWGVDFESLIKQMQEDYWNIPAIEFKEKYIIKREK